MSAQQEVAFAAGDERIGSTFEVLVDERIEPGVVSGRHQGQAPMVDGVTFVEGCDAGPGEFVNVRCVGRETYDLMAKPTRRALRVLRA